MTQHSGVSDSLLLLPPEHNFDLQASHGLFDVCLLPLVYTREYLVFVCFRQTLHSLTLTGYYWILLDLTGPYWVLLDLTESYWILLDVTGCYWILLHLTWSYWISLDPTGSYRILPGLTGSYWVLLNLISLRAPSDLLISSDSEWQWKADVLV